MSVKMNLSDTTLSRLAGSPMQFMWVHGGTITLQFEKPKQAKRKRSF